MHKSDLENNLIACKQKSEEQGRNGGMVAEKSKLLSFSGLESGSRGRKWEKEKTRREGSCLGAFEKS